VKTVERKENGKLTSKIVNGEETLAIEPEPSSHYRYRS